MVLINLKSSLPTGPITANDSFLYETTAATRNDDLITSLVDIHNARVRSNLLVDATRGLAAYGVMKKPDEAGTDEVIVWMLCVCIDCVPTAGCLKSIESIS